MKRQLCLPLLASLVLVAACGDDSSSQPDAPVTPDGSSACATATVGEITTYPGTFSGTVVGGGADLTVAEDSCTTQTDDQWYDQVGEDVVVRLGGLTAGETYVVALETEDDIGFYVTTGCPPATGAVTGCLNFTDATIANETGTFVATAAEHYLVIDHLVDPNFPLTSGNFKVDVAQAACTPETEATDCAAPTPFCSNFQCVQCTSSYDCTMATPVCSAEATCVAGPMTCTGDDIRDTTAPGDDGPAAATTIAAPGVGTPTVVAGAVCNSPSAEADWFQVVLPANDIGIELDFTGATNDLDVYLLTAAGSIVVAGEADPGINERIRTTNLMAGTYYVVVTQYRPANNIAAVPYTLTLRRTECTNDFQCLVAGAPVCSGSGVCGAGPALCVGDDAADNGAGDDGPAAARELTGAVGVATTLTGSVCSSPASEADFYKVTVANGQGMTVQLSWTGPTIDLDPVVYDATGATLGFSFYLNPENVALTYLPAGTYYIKVSNFAQTASTTSTAYTITATRTAAQTCATSADCAAEYSTQLYRGQCVTATGTCQFIPPGMGAAGAACDSGNDCTSNRCSYIPFDADAQHSKCTMTCTTSADCAGLGTTPAFTCTSGLQTNFCVPGCTTDLQCGANTGSAMVDTGLPWNYLTCTAATNVCSI